MKLSIEEHLVQNRSIEDHGYITPCWIWTAYINDRGYGKIRRGNKIWRVHVLSAFNYFTNFKDNLLVLHKCNIKACFNPEHLYQGTQKENAQDMMKAGNFFMNFLRPPYNTQYNKDTREHSNKKEESDEN